MHIPSFQGKNNAEANLEWEWKLNHIFDYHNFSEEKKIKLATLEFIDYALAWYE